MHQAIELLKRGLPIAAKIELLATDRDKPASPLTTPWLGDLGVDQPLSFSSDENTQEQAERFVRGAR